MRKAVFVVSLAVFCVLAATCVYARTKKAKKTKRTPVLEQREAAQETVLSKEESSSSDGAASQDIDALLASNNGAAYKREAIEGEAVSFNEIWAFYTSFYKSDENRLDANAQVTDIALFGAEIGSYGDLEGVPPPSRAKTARKDFNGRVHLTFACSSRGVTHFCLDPKYDIRSPLLNAIAAASRGFDGVVCDLEYIPARDRENFISFLKSLKIKIGKKTLTVCVPARVKSLQGDTFPYKEISAVSDRVFVMAYDEHWGSSKPGPVASYGWCEKVADYAVSAVPEHKLIMGIPFYARAWVDKSKNPVGAWRYSKFNNHLAQNGVTKIERTEDGEGHVRYSVTVDVDAYFDDAYSLHKKCAMYAEKGVQNMGVWCIGQDDTEFWKTVKSGQG